MLHRGEMTVLERQQQQALHQQEQLLQGRFFAENNCNEFGMMQQQFPGVDDSAIREFLNRSMKLDPGLDSGWPDYQMSGVGTGMMNRFGGNGFGLIDHSSRTTSCQLPTAPVSPGGKKRKTQTQNPKVAEEVREKKMKGESEGESKVTEHNNSNNSSHSNNNKEVSGDSVKKNSKASEVQKQDYIHVRARRGQATDSHSLAERVRREKISERMKYLQDLVPGCNKITGKAGMLDEIINYVQSLQRQVEFLSMKLAAVNPRLDFNIENIFAKEMFSANAAGFPIGAPTEMPNCPTYLPMNSLQQLVSSCGMDMPMSSSDMALQRARSLPIPEAFLDASCYTQAPAPASNWDTEMQSLYNVEFNQARPAAFQPQSFTGILEANNLKMEM